MDRLNYHHLRYFREVARDGNLTRTAERMNLSQSALSTQIRTLEARLGHDLFDRSGRMLRLTEAGRIALDHAEGIFQGGAALLTALAGDGQTARPLRIGALSTLSRNFQMQFLQPLIGRDDVQLSLVSGGPRTLLDGLAALALDIVLTTDPPPVQDESRFETRRLSSQPVSLHAVPTRLDHPSLAALLAAEPVILPTESAIRRGFDALTRQLDIAPRIVAEVDDMAMVRLLTRAGAGVAVSPAIVLADEIAVGMLATAPFDLGIEEVFFAVIAKRDFPHPAVADLLAKAPSAPSAQR